MHNSTTTWDGGKDNHDKNVNARWGIRNQSGCAPFMIQVPTTVDWPDEGQNIGGDSGKYPNFTKWVGNNGQGWVDKWYN